MELRQSGLDLNAPESEAQIVNSHHGCSVHNLNVSLSTQLQFFSQQLQMTKKLSLLALYLQATVRNTELMSCRLVSCQREQQHTNRLEMTSLIVGELLPYVMTSQRDTRQHEV